MKLLVIDIETTGFSVDADDLLEVAAVAYEAGEHKTEFAHLVKPRKKTWWGGKVVELHQITPELALSEGREAHDVLSKLLRWTERADALVAYNASFEDRWLRKVCFDLGLTWIEKPWIDPMKLVNRFLTKSELSERNLKAVCRHFGIPLEKAHQALPDTRATGNLLYQIIERYKVNLEDEVAGRSKQLGGFTTGDGPFEALFGGYRQAGG